MKVLYITNSVGMGGASVAILNILPFLIKLGVRPYVLYPQNGLFSERLNELGIENGVFIIRKTKRFAFLERTA